MSAYEPKSDIVQGLLVQGQWNLDMHILMAMLKLEAPRSEL